jgi:uncharacterized protein (DUF2336 family)
MDGGHQPGQNGARVVQAQRSLIAEVENAIASGSPDKRVETLRRVTDLFMVSADDYSEEQVDVFDDVISRLADRIELKARAELASRLAPVRNAPTMVVRSLARDESIDVAGPVLTHSSRLTDDDLVACAGDKGQDRLLAISKRKSLSERVSDVLVTRGDNEVMRSIAKNEGARFSNSGFGKLVEKSESDDELAVSVGLRRDIPKEHFYALVSKASEAVFKKLAASNPAAAAEVNRVLYDLTGVMTAPKSKPRPKFDYSNAQQIFEGAQRSSQPIDLVVRDFAQSGKFEETVVALASLCALTTDVVENIMLDKRIDNDLVLILAKAAGLNWHTVKLILQFRAGESGISATALEKAYQHYERLQAATAKRVVRFYQVRQVAGDKANG